MGRAALRHVQIGQETPKWQAIGFARGCLADWRANDVLAFFQYDYRLLGAPRSTVSSLAGDCWCYPPYPTTDPDDVEPACSRRVEATKQFAYLEMFTLFPPCRYTPRRGRTPAVHRKTQTKLARGQYEVRMQLVDRRCQLVRPLSLCILIYDIFRCNRPTFNSSAASLSCSRLTPLLILNLVEQIWPTGRTQTKDTRKDLGDPVLDYKKATVDRQRNCNRPQQVELWPSHLSTTVTHFWDLQSSPSTISNTCLTILSSAALHFDLTFQNP